MHNRSIFNRDNYSATYYARGGEISTSWMLFCRSLICLHFSDFCRQANLHRRSASGFFSRHRVNKWAAADIWSRETQSTARTDSVFNQYLSAPSWTSRSDATCEEFTQLKIPRWQCSTVSYHERVSQHHEDDCILHCTEFAWRIG